MYRSEPFSQVAVWPNKANGRKCSDFSGLRARSCWRPVWMQARRSISSRLESLPRLLEILQIRRRLVLLRRHQVAVGADIVDLPADADMRIVLGADRLAPPDRLLARGPAVVLGDGPGPRQGMVDGGDLVVQEIAVGLVEIDALLDHGLIVLVHGNAGAVEGARPFQAAGLDRQQVVAAIAILVDPLADRVARKHRLHLLRPIAAVGIDAAGVV